MGQIHLSEPLEEVVPALTHEGRPAAPSSSLVMPPYPMDRSTDREVVKAVMPQSRPLRKDPPPSQEFEVRPLGDASVRRAHSSSSGLCLFTHLFCLVTCRGP